MTDRTSPSPAHAADLDAADAALAAALAAPAEPATLSLDELAERAGVSPAVLEAIAREGLLTATDVGGQPRYTEADAEAVSAGLSLLDAGLPLGELLELARHFDAALSEVADHAVERFLTFVRDPIKGASDPPDEAATRLVGAFESMLPATGALVGHYIQRLLVEAARARLDDIRAGRPATGPGPES